MLELTGFNITKFWISFVHTVNFMSVIRGIQICVNVRLAKLLSLNSCNETLGVLHLSERVTNHFC